MRSFKSFQWGDVPTDCEQWAVLSLQQFPLHPQIAEELIFDFIDSVSAQGRLSSYDWRREPLIEGFRMNDRLRGFRSRRSPRERSRSRERARDPSAAAAEWASAGSTQSRQKAVDATKHVRAPPQPSSLTPHLPPSPPRHESRKAGAGGEPGEAISVLTTEPQSTLTYPPSLAAAKPSVREVIQGILAEKAVSPPSALAPSSAAVTAAHGQSRKILPTAEWLNALHEILLKNSTPISLSGLNRPDLPLRDKNDDIGRIKARVVFAADSRFSLVVDKDQELLITLSRAQKTAPTTKPAPLTSTALVKIPPLDHSDLLVRYKSCGIPHSNKDILVAYPEFLRFRPWANEIFSGMVRNQLLSVPLNSISDLFLRPAEDETLTSLKETLAVDPRFQIVNTLGLHNVLIPGQELLAVSSTFKCWAAEKPKKKFKSSVYVDVETTFADYEIMRKIQIGPANPAAQKARPSSAYKEISSTTVWAKLADTLAAAEAAPDAPPKPAAVPAQRRTPPALSIAIQSDVSEQTITQRDAVAVATSSHSTAHSPGASPPQPHADEVTGYGRGVTVALRLPTDPELPAAEKRARVPDVLGLQFCPFCAGEHAALECPHSGDLSMTRGGTPHLFSAGIECMRCGRLGHALCLDAERIRVFNCTDMHVAVLPPGVQMCDHLSDEACDVLSSLRIPTTQGLCFLCGAEDHIGIECIAEEDAEEVDDAIASARARARDALGAIAGGA